MSSRRPTLDFISHSPDQTRRFGFHLGRLAEPGQVCLLAGEIGAGKTTLVQGIARGLGVDGYVQSPTFTLAVEHAGRAASGESVMLYHLDLYRLEGLAGLDTFGFEEYLDDPAGIAVIEWPDRLVAGMPDEYLLIRLEHLADTKRRLVFLPVGERYEALVANFRTEVFGAPRRTTSSSD